ncbi:hypothetical protein HNP38_002080 [Chryseobacterium defluvii]|uniref:Uncharacterized protein n=1 Tax=Chryseobacterium defluvii TaxID=160396 RepID=A0A840KGF3_9FLAO|nr:hypothetical protein [Chryseobacterium defluvii]
MTNGISLQKIRTINLNKLLTFDNSQHFQNNTSNYFVNHSETIKFAVQFLRIYGKNYKECSERTRR